MLHESNSTNDDNDILTLSKTIIKAGIFVVILGVINLIYMGLINVESIIITSFITIIGFTISIIGKVIPYIIFQKQQLHDITKQLAKIENKLEDRK